MHNAAITGWGHYVPERALTNAELESRIGTTDEWIRTRTGIQERRIAGSEETTSTLCTAAARRALSRAALPAGAVDLVICATTTPDQLLPNTASLIQQRLGAGRAGAFDVNAACTGFLCALAIASQFIRAGTFERVLVVGGETLSRFTNWDDRATCVLFGDGAGAIVLEATDQESGVLSSVLGSQGDVDQLLAIPAGGAARPATLDTVARGEHFISMRGGDIFRLAVRAMTRASVEALEKAGVPSDDVRAVVAHQANVRILRATQQALGVPWEKFVINLDRYGNTGAASIPIALSELLTSEKVQPGEHLLLAGFGGGLTWASSVVRWADVEAIIAARPAPLAAASCGGFVLPIDRTETALAG
jgi:3-oxoacyl-[acyl-carrier-protein] synthase-3